MDLKLDVLRLASGLAAHAAARQQVIAENIAHADTPGYRARDVADFADDARAGRRRSPRGRPGRGTSRFGADPRGFEPREAAAFGAETPNGNTVGLEDQMIRAAEVRQSHDMALGVYAKSLEILRTALGRR